MNAIRIAELRDEERPAWDASWDAYVRRAEGGLPQHLSAWSRVLQRTYDYETRYLMSLDTTNDASERTPERTPERSERVVGVLPLFVIRSALVGRTVTTLPGGMCADSPEAAAALLARGSEIAREVRAKRLVLHDTRRQWPGDLQTVCEHESRRIDLRAGEEAIWKKLDRNIRRQVRIAERNELRALVDRTGERLDDFYSVLSRFTHQAGTPVFSRAFLQNVIDAFPDGFSIAMVYKADEPIGGYFQLEMGDTAYGTWGATLHEYLELRPVYLAYWQILSDAASHGFAYLDMGRSPRDTTAAQYKAQWGGCAAPVYQQSIVFGSEKSSDAQTIAVQTRSDARMQTFRRFWPNLPFPVAQALGPYFRRHVPFA